MPAAVTEAVFAARPAGVIAFVLLVPAITSAEVASWTPPRCRSVAGVSEIRPLATSIPLPMTTAPNCVFDAADRLMFTLGPAPPPVNPVDRVMLLTVPTPGGSADSVPSGATVRLDPIFTPPSVTFVAGIRLMVPVVVIGPPERPTPVAT